jgi:predicted nucleic acid-binding protein
MLEGIESGTIIFIDTNIFLYKIFEHRKYAKPCSMFLKNINSGKYIGLISIFVCNEVFHRVMMAELMEQYKLEAKQVPRFIKDNPDAIKNLSAAWSAIDNIKEIENLRIVGVGNDAFELALGYSRRYGLLSNDAVHLAIMKQEGVSTMASNDRDFEKVDWLKLWTP